MISAYLTDIHEPWIDGNPELSVRIAQFSDSVDNTASYVSCAGELRSSPFYYDQNSSSWSGDVSVAAPSDVQNKVYEIQIWEDDGADCNDSGQNFVPDNNDPEYIDDILSGVAAVVEFPDSLPDTWQEKLKLGGKWAGIVYSLRDVLNNDDDFVGYAKLPTGSCFSTATGAYEFTLLDRSNSYAGTASIVNDFATRNVCPFDITLQGPSEGRPGDYCTWTVDIANGTSPYSYSWGGIASGSGSSKSITLSSSGYISVTVTDGNGHSDADDIYVTVASGATACGI